MTTCASVLLGGFPESMAVTVRLSQGVASLSTAPSTVSTPEVGCSATSVEASEPWGMDGKYFSLVVEINVVEISDVFSINN